MTGPVVISVQSEIKHLSLPATLPLIPAKGSRARPRMVSRFLLLDPYKMRHLRFLRKGLFVSVKWLLQRHLLGIWSRWFSSKIFFVSQKFSSLRNSESKNIWTEIAAPRSFCIVKWELSLFTFSDIAWRISWLSNGVPHKGRLAGGILWPKIPSLP